MDVFVDTNVLFPFAVMDLMLALTEDAVHEVWNRNDFPAGELARWGIRVLDPDEYLRELIVDSPGEVVETVVRLAGEKKRPPLTPQDLSARLAKAGTPNFAARLTELL